ncbi:hypothetical protein VHUM_02172 [Vanrija humicola]|uniref:DUF952 domain-containing protein n=1 Tax=Vanrija humicola TaxID=5417 RepID=A0A7D8V014_VANHU|nr:hypothetical protein VHUM_02172 [Vanrija humicola]
MASQNPTYIYKIFPSATVDSRFYFPTPIPSSHEFFLSELDSKDGFVHLSTAQQVPGTLKRFFADAEQVAILRLEYARLSAWKRVRWEQAGNGDSYPHLYALLEGQDIDSFKEIEQGGDWDKALASISNWLV